MLFSLVQKNIFKKMCKVGYLMYTYSVNIKGDIQNEK